MSSCITSTFVSFTTKVFDCVNHCKLDISVFLETYTLVKKQQLELGMEQPTGSKLGNEYDKAVYCHPAYLPHMRSTSCEMLGWKNYKLESR